MSKRTKILIFSVSALLLLSFMVGITYSLWTANYEQEGTNELTVGCFNVSYTNLNEYGGNSAGDISLINAYPITEAAGSAKTPYVFKIKNECEVAASYAINIETLNTSNFNTDYLRVKFNEASNNSGTSSLYKDITTANPTLQNVTSAKQLTTGYLTANEEVTYALRIWIDIDATTETPNVMGATWNGKVVVNSEATRLTAVNTITRLATGADTTSTNVIGNTGLAYDGTTDNNLRYVGSNPNNYVRFNNELWRIIGVMNNIQTEGGQTQSLLKIVRNDRIGSYAWDSTDESINGGGGTNQWGPSGTYEGADLMRELNYDYLGDIQVGTDGKWYNELNNSKSTNMPTTTLSSNAQSMIESVVWNLGSPSTNNTIYDTNWTNNISPSTSYYRERNSDALRVECGTATCNDDVVRTSTWTGKVGLIYPSDYGYATVGGNTTNRTTCLGYSMYLWDNSDVLDCKTNDWLYHPQFGSWTLSPASAGSR